MPYLFQRDPGADPAGPVAQRQSRHARAGPPGCTGPERTRSSPSIQFLAARLPQALRHRPGEQRPAHPYRRGPARALEYADHSRLCRRVRRRRRPPLPGIPRPAPGNARPADEYRPAHRRGMDRIQRALRQAQGRARRLRAPYGTPCQHEHACISCPMLPSTRRCCPASTRSRPT